MGNSLGLWYLVRGNMYSLGMACTPVETQLARTAQEDTLTTVLVLALALALTLALNSS